MAWTGKDNVGTGATAATALLAPDWRRFSIGMALLALGIALLAAHTSLLWTHHRWLGSIWHDYLRLGMALLAAVGWMLAGTALRPGGHPRLGALIALVLYAATGDVVTRFVSTSLPLGCLSALLPGRMLLNPILLNLMWPSTAVNFLARWVISLSAPGLCI